MWAENRNERICRKCSSVSRKKERDYQEKEDRVFDESRYPHIFYRYSGLKSLWNYVAENFLSRAEGANVAAINVAEKHYQHRHAYQQQKGAYWRYRQTMKRQQGCNLFAGKLDIEQDATHNKIQYEHSQSAPESAAVDYYQGDRESTDQI